MRVPAAIARIPELRPLLEGADHIDVKIVTGTVDLRRFVASMLGYQPGWLTGLYRIQAVLVRVIALRQTGVPRRLRMTPNIVPMRPGSSAGFFTVRMAEEDRYWIAEASEKHLEAALGVVVESLDDGRRCFYVLTVVRYHAWTGPVYFNLIRPFHHIVVGRMAAPGVRTPTLVRPGASTP